MAEGALHKASAACTLLPVEQEPIITEGGWVRIADSNNFPAASTIAAALVNLEPGAMRELHWHEHDEWQYYIKGRGRMTVFASSGTMSPDFGPGNRVTETFPRT